MGLNVKETFNWYYMVMMLYATPGNIDKTTEEELFIYKILQMDVV